MRTIFIFFFLVFAVAQATLAKSTANINQEGLKELHVAAEQDGSDAVVKWSALDEFLVICLWVSVLCFILTFGLIVIPATQRELKLWRYLRVRVLRLWITRRRNVIEPLHPQLTVKIARKNLLWHLLLTGLFCSQLAWALLSEAGWWRPLTIPLVVFSVAYFIGSVIQRQKIVIIWAREN